MAGSRVILGIDPGLALLGYGVIAARGSAIEHVVHGCVTTPAGAPVDARLRTLYEQLRALRAQFAITDVAMESLYYSRNVRTAMAVGQARGVALLATVDASVCFGEYTPSQVKQIVAGYGAARKRAMQEMVRLLLRLPALPAPDDAADALAIALCHARQADLAALVSAS